MSIRLPRFLVGVGYCIEREFEDCIESINSQVDCELRVFVLEGLTQKEAHNQLYDNFMAQAGDFDYFIKVDADMVLERPTLFKEIAAKFDRSPELVHLQIGVYDWMTDSLIFGLHVYRSSYNFVPNVERIFVDVASHSGKFDSDATELAPAALHCRDPSEFQAYHFGLHKGVKFVQKDTMNVREDFRGYHWNHFLNMEKHYLRSKDRRLAFALLGFQDAIRWRWGSDEVDFTNERVKIRFLRLKRLFSQLLHKGCLWSWRTGHRGLPPEERYEWTKYWAHGSLPPHTVISITARIVRIRLKAIFRSAKALITSAN